MINDSKLEFKEKFDPALISALYQNFGDPLQAILELVDNTIDDMVPGRKMYITVECDRDCIRIVNKGGNGMGPKELGAFFVWGKSNKRGKLGRYGQGGKAAMGYLGRSWTIKSTKTGESNAYVIKEKNWDNRAEGLKSYVPIMERTSFVEDGVVQIEISKLKKKINKNELRRTLARVYRPLIAQGLIEIYSPGKVTAFEYDLESPEEYFPITLKSGKRIGGWVSLLKKGSKTRGGVRCYVFGRLVSEREFFGQKDPTYKESIDSLIGELYIDDEDLPLLINKSGVDRGSEIWKEICKVMYVTLQPYINLLLEEKDRDVPSEKERTLSNYAGKIWSEFLQSLQETQMSGELLSVGLSYGQKQPERRVEKPEEGNSEKLPSTIIRDPYNPASPPPHEAIGNRKRTNSFLRPVPKPLHETVRYETGIIDGTKTIFINTKYPLYKLRKNQLTLYIWETLALEYAKEEDAVGQTVESYYVEVSRLMYDLCSYLKSNNIKLDKTRS